MDGLGFCRWVALRAGIDDESRQSTGETLIFPAVHLVDGFRELEAGSDEKDGGRMCGRESGAYLSTGGSRDS